MESHGGAQMQDNTSPSSSSGFNSDRLPDDSARDTPGEYWNWNRSRVTTPSRSIEVTSYQEFQAIVRDYPRYPGPVRAAGSMHSVTDAIVNDGGTLILLSGISSVLGLVSIALAVYLGWQGIEGLRFV
jgi:FAD/FMN-containing dehydrogenase